MGHPLRRWTRKWQPLSWVCSSWSTQFSSMSARPNAVILCQHKIRIFANWVKINQTSCKFSSKTCFNLCVFSHQEFLLCLFLFEKLSSKPSLCMWQWEDKYFKIRRQNHQQLQSFVSRGVRLRLLFFLIKRAERQTHSSRRCLCGCCLFKKNINHPQLRLV